uniref:Uncharacterized protein n=1 Tax=Romanomermis culicivorax TaxID=13658 RepID=A0A915KXZ7_ROMCU
MVGQEDKVVDGEIPYLGFSIKILFTYRRGFFKLCALLATTSLYSPPPTTPFAFSLALAWELILCLFFSPVFILFT